MCRVYSELAVLSRAKRQTAQRQSRGMYAHGLESTLDLGREGAVGIVERARYLQFTSISVQLAARPHFDGAVAEREV